MIGRLLDTGAGEGAWNMAVDEALLEGLRLGLSPPTLRVYAWAAPTISLGRAQALDPTLGDWPMVRRPTGGRAVWHAQDFTYAVTASGLPTGVTASYALLADGLAAGLARLGVATHMGEASRPGRSAACFASPTAADLKAGAAKLLGSAQTRRAGAMLQHGTLYLRAPQLPHEGQVADLAGLLGRVPGWEELRDALAWGLGQALGLAWEPGELTDWELARVAATQQEFRI